MKKLSKDAIRASWESERESIRQHLLNREVPFNPKSVDKFIENFISSMVFANIPCTSEKGIAGAWKAFKTEAREEKVPPRSPETGEQPCTLAELMGRKAGEPFA